MLAVMSQTNFLAPQHDGFKISLRGLAANWTDESATLYQVRSFKLSYAQIWDNQRAAEPSH